MMLAFPVKFTAGDSLPALSGVLDGEDLTGYTVTLRIKRPDPAPILEKVATILDQTTSRGAFSFGLWDNGDLIAGYLQLCDIVFVNGGGEILTSMQFTIDVETPV